MNGHLHHSVPVGSRRERDVTDLFTSLEVSEDIWVGREREGAPA